MKPDAISGSSIDIKPVEDFVFQGLQSRIHDVFGAISVWTTGPDKVKALEKMFTTEKVKYPYCFLMLSSMALATERQNPFALALRGIPAMITSDLRRTFRARVLPTDFTVSMEFVTNSNAESLKFSKAWLFASRMNRLSFDIDYGRTVLGIKVVMDTSVTIPQKGVAPEEVTEYIVQTNLVVNGFVSEQAVEHSNAEMAEITSYLPGGESLSPDWVVNTPPVT